MLKLEQNKKNPNNKTKELTKQNTEKSPYFLEKAKEVSRNSNQNLGESFLMEYEKTKGKKCVIPLFLIKNSRIKLFEPSFIKYAPKKKNLVLKIKQARLSNTLKKIKGGFLTNKKGITSFFPYSIYGEKVKNSKGGFYFKFFKIYLKNNQNKVYQNSVASKINLTFALKKLLKTLFENNKDYNFFVNRKVLNKSVRIFYYYEKDTFKIRIKKEIMIYR